jgi:hypothetical protein
MNRSTLSWCIVACFMAVIAVVLHAPDAWAIGDDVTLGAFRCTGGTANGQLLISGASCPKTLSFDTLFSFLICNFEQLSSNLLGHMFCGMVKDLTPAVWAAVSLAIAVFGVSFTIGLIPATGQEAMMFIIKLAFITAFATNADYLIGYGYTFLIVGMREGVTIVLTSLSSSGITSGADVYAQVDKIMASLFHFATDAVGSTAKANFCQNALFAVIALLAIALPIAAYVALLLIARIVLTLFRSVFAYVYALMAIAFLLTLAPFFLSFYLFKQTRNLFDRWIGYLVSFTLQVVLLFAFLTFIVILFTTISKENVAKEITTLVMPAQETIETTALRFPLSYCTLCKFEVVDRVTKVKLDADSPDYISKGMLQCTTPKTPLPPNFASSPDSFVKGGGAGKGTPRTDGPVFQLLTFMRQGLIPLIVLVLVIEKLLGLLPALAQRLASGLGASYATQLGGGESTAARVARMPGESYLDNFADGFKEGYGNKTNKDAVSKTSQGFKDAFSSLVTGRTSDGRRIDGYKDDDPNAPAESAGIKNSFSRWLRDPSSFGQ